MTIRLYRSHLRKGVYVTRQQLSAEELQILRGLVRPVIRRALRVALFLLRLALRTLSFLLTGPEWSTRGKKREAKEIVLKF
jgi:hypothetical protein